MCRESLNKPRAHTHTDTHPGLISIKCKAEITGTSKGNWKDRGKKNWGGGAGVGETEEKKGKGAAAKPASVLQIGSAARRCPQATCQIN